jgi:diguanylate cyclase (GGDEF)-like protein
MQLHARLMGRIASLGLGLVFVALITCTLWATARIQRAADHAATAVTLSDLYSSANRDLDIEASLERRHLNDVNSGSWREELDAAQATIESLTSIAHSQNADDREVGAAALKLHDTYLDTLRELYRAVDLGSMQYAATVDHEEADPQFAAVQTPIASRATDQHGVALTALADLAATQSLNVRTIVIATILGLIQLGVCTLILAGYQRKVESARRAELAALEQASLTDNLTGLGNHRAFQEELDAQLARVDRRGSILSLAVVDIDEFKAINDRNGHLHGDRVLAAMGALLGEVRKGDRTFRVGGDEFAIVLPDAETVQASILMERIRQAAPGRLFGSTLSIGIATTNANQPCDAVTLRAQADAALYAGKQSGRNTVITYADAERGELVLSPAKAQALRRLIDEGHVDVVFQPIWDSQKGRPFGFEALARPPADCGLSGPAEAFEIAERVGRAPALDAICLRAILGRAGELPPDALLFINIVPETLDRDLLSGNTLVDAVLDAGIAPGRVVIELTERAMPRLDIIIREAKRIQSLGFKLALDDTGAGNAGLEVLRQLPVDFVKIDRAVVVQAMTDPTARAIVASIVAIAHAMGACVIAEGIETVEALDFVRRDVMRGWHPESGIRGVQGYLLGRPAAEPWNDPNAEAHSALMQKTYDDHKPAPRSSRRRAARTSYRRLARLGPSEWQTL